MIWAMKPQTGSCIKEFSYRFVHQLIKGPIEPILQYKNGPTWSKLLQRVHTYWLLHTDNVYSFRSRIIYKMFPIECLVKDKFPSFGILVDVSSNILCYLLEPLNFGV